MSVYLTSLNCMCKMIKMVNFTLYIFYHNFKGNLYECEFRKQCLRVSKVYYSMGFRSFSQLSKKFPGPIYSWL